MINRFSQLVMKLHLGCREQPANEYQNWALEQVKSVLYFDSALWITGALNGEGQAAVHTIHAHRLSPQIVADWARIPQSRAVLTERVFQSPGVTFNCVTANEFGPELLEHSRRYSIEHILATTSIDIISRLSELISVYRADPDRPFSEEERLVQQNIVPHLAETWRINRTHHMNLAQHPSRRANACSAVIDRKGVLHLHDSAFTALLLGEWPDWQGPTLPESLVRLVGNGDGTFAGKTLVARSSDDMGDFLILRARNRTMLDTLSKREMEVANHFAAGVSYKRIAESLSLSPTTIRNHLSNLYSKLGIGNKAELIALLVNHDRMYSPEQ